MCRAEPPLGGISSGSEQECARLEVRAQGRNAAWAKWYGIEARCDLALVTGQTHISGGARGTLKGEGG